ncbi:hypothetical protein D3C72_1948620 [compost metagenome]
MLLGGDGAVDRHGVVVAPFAGHLQHIGANAQLRGEQGGDFIGFVVGPVTDLGQLAEEGLEQRPVVVSKAGR